MAETFSEISLFEAIFENIEWRIKCPLESLEVWAIEVYLDLLIDFPYLYNIICPVRYTESGYIKFLFETTVHTRYVVFFYFESKIVHAIPLDI